jgi:hypothetical protein
MGYFAFEPTIPFSLGEQLSPSNVFSLEQESQASSPSSLSSTLPEVDFADSFEVDTMEFSPGAAEMSPGVPLQAREQMRSQLDEALKVFEDIEGIKEKKAPGSALEDDFEIEIDFDLDGGIAQEPTEERIQDEAKSGVMPAELEMGNDFGTELESLQSFRPPAGAHKADTMDLSDEDLERLMEDVELDRGLTLDLEFDSDLVMDDAATIQMPQSPHISGSEFSAAPPVLPTMPAGPAIPLVQDGEEGLELELSEDDLDKIVLELEDITLEEGPLDGRAKPGGSNTVN